MSQFQFGNFSKMSEIQKCPKGRTGGGVNPNRDIVPKRAVRAFPAKTSWGTTRPLIGQAAHGRRAGIILLTAWQIRGLVVPHEVLAGNALTSLFSRFSILMPPLTVS